MTILTDNMAKQAIANFIDGNGPLMDDDGWVESWVHDANGNDVLVDLNIFVTEVDGQDIPDYSAYLYLTKPNGDDNDIIESSSTPFCHLLTNDDLKALGIDQSV